MLPRRRRGAASVEFALTLPILISLGLGTVEFGWYFTQHAWIHHVARDAARVAVNSSQGAVQARAQAYAQELLVNEYGVDCAGGCVITATVNDTLVAGFYTLQLTVEVPYDSMTDFLGNRGVVIPTTLEATVVMPLMDQTP